MVQPKCQEYCSVLLYWGCIKNEYPVRLRHSTFGKIFFYFLKCTESFGVTSWKSRTLGLQRETKKIFLIDAPINFFIAIFRMSFFFTISFSRLSLSLGNDDGKKVWRKKNRNTPGAVMQSQSLPSIISLKHLHPHTHIAYKFKSIVYIILETQNLFFTYYSISFRFDSIVSNVSQYVFEYTFAFAIWGDSQAIFSLVIDVCSIGKMTLSLGCTKFYCFAYLGNWRNF